jgi:tetratricopeptide (TPR) repeat protein/predicted Ser/Thr protein kinase
MSELDENTLAATPGAIDDTLAAMPGGIDNTLAVMDEPGVAAKRRGGQLGRGDVVGRYVVLSKLGAGGMGVVYAAYDPELDRKVAVKMLLADPSGASMPTEGRSRLLREAQALAKFSHPEIVAVYDVGEHEAGVWLAMEFVDGRTLSGWAREHARGWREVLDVMVAAGRGVAAAHAAGLVHRDLKPDNIMVGNDGRVRVMDFGLTRSQAEAVSTPVSAPEDAALSSSHREQLSGPLTQQGSLLGTPAYMAPEQFSGADVTAAADQFSYCVTLWELMFGERPFTGDSLAQLAAAVIEGRLRAPTGRRRVPAWLRRTCERGLARSPAERWPSMQVLLAELERGHTRARVRGGAVLLSGVVLVGLLALGYQRRVEEQAVLACERDGASIDEVWNDDVRARVRAGLLATQAGYAGAGYADTTVEKLLPYIDAQAESWRRHRTAACRSATLEQTWDADTLDRATWCLDERRLELASLLDEFERADAMVLQKAVSAAAGLAQISPCTDVDTLSRLPPPPSAESRAQVIEVRAELAHASTLLAAGKYRDALAAVTPARARAEALDWPPLSAEALRVEALSLEKLGEFEQAEQRGVAAYMAAAKAGAWGIAADAATRLAYDVGVRQAREREGRIWAEHAEVAIGFAGDGLGIREASRLTTLGVISEIEAEFDEARALHERALALLEQALGPEHPDLAPIFNNLGNVGYAIHDFELGKLQFERSLALRERTLGPEHPDVASSLNNLGSLSAVQKDFVAAEQLFERARGILERALGPNHPDVAASLNNLAYVAKQTGAHEQAKRQYQQMLAILEETLGAEHPDLALGLTNLALVELVLEQPEQALPSLERAVKIYDAHEGVQNNELQARFALARALVATGGDGARAIAEASKARDGFREFGEGKQDQMVEVEAWLADQAQD